MRKLNTRHGPAARGRAVVPRHPQCTPANRRDCDNADCTHSSSAGERRSFSRPGVMRQSPCGGPARCRRSRSELRQADQGANRQSRRPLPNCCGDVTVLRRLQPNQSDGGVLHRLSALFRSTSPRSSGLARAMFRASFDDARPASLGFCLQTEHRRAWPNCRSRRSRARGGPIPPRIYRPPRKGDGQFGRRMAREAGGLRPCPDLRRRKPNRRPPSAPSADLGPLRLS